MKYFAMMVLVLGLTGCFGYSAKQSEMAGQVKKITRFTPIICPDRVEVDVSLGVIRNGVGSMSTQDVWALVEDKSLEAKLKDAQEKGSPVTITYDTARVVFCPNTHKVVTGVEVLK